MDTNSGLHLFDIISVNLTFLDILSNLIKAPWQNIKYTFIVISFAVGV